MPDASAAREQAREILAEKRYRPTDVPRPFKKPLDWLGDRLNSVGDWFGRRIDDLDGVLPGGGWVVWAVIGLGVAVTAFVIARSAIGRSVSGLGRSAGTGVARVDPADLEHEAAEAERAGDFEHAVRLRFRAGVLRLERGEGETTGEIAASLESPVFDALGADHDAIAYGGRPAGSQDADTARSDWPRVVEEARR
ncbi:MAG: hypothetical protein QOF76_1791 [Solirubrobacteraceae bacterium]|nr:hypothetical protein [Solirubrobacteraceae bacterium]